MYIPSQAQWQKVIDTFYNILPLALENEHHLDMAEPAVNIYHECGTVHCVGGWYAIGKYKEDAFSNSRDNVLSFSNGVISMAHDLGFGDHASDLEDWVDENHKIWGNRLGRSMFYSPSAYDHGNGPAKNIIDVIHHFEFVKHNCFKYDKSKRAK